MSNRKKIRSALVRVPDPADVDPHSPHGRTLHASALRRREPTVEELVELSGHGFDTVTGPLPIVAVETTEGVRFENLHKIGWPTGCGCGTPSCTSEVAS